MNIIPINFCGLPYPAYYKQYLNKDSAFIPYYRCYPIDKDRILNEIEQYQFKGDRQKLVNNLKAYHTELGIYSNLKENIQKLLDPNVICITSGQQLGFYGGPLYTFYKVISLIYYALTLKKYTSRTIIPIFWLADEDHDIEEIHSVNMYNHHQLVPIHTNVNIGYHNVVSHHIPSWDILTTLIQNNMPNTIHSHDVWKMIKTAYHRNATIRQGFATFLSMLFAKYGLIFAGSYCKEIKESTKEIMQKAILKASQLKNSQLHHQKQLPIQVKISDEFLFYISPEGTRQKIRRKNETQWYCNHKEWSQQDLLTEIDTKPSRFSPNVLLRCIIQDNILPNVMTLVGPGELAYYGQMKTIYDQFDIKMPIIMPRFCATFGSISLSKILKHIPFNQLFSPLSELSLKLIDKNKLEEIRSHSITWHKKQKQHITEHILWVKSIDPTLESAMKAWEKQMEDKIRWIEKKLIKAEKKKNQYSIDNLKKAQSFIYPLHQMQERQLSALYIMLTKGVNVWQNIIEQLTQQYNNIIDHHFLIESDDH